MERVAGGDLDSTCDAEVLQELLYRYWHLRLLDQGMTLVDYVVCIVPTILPVGKQDVLLAKTFLAQHQRMEPRDAIHAATMLNHGITHLYSYDQSFDAIPDLTRLEP